ncbi:MAG: hypothetical protein AB1349_13065 [Elusimicrobiota bacterium]
MPNVTVSELIWDGPQCVGIKTNSDDDILYADVIILAEGANAVLAEKEGLKNVPSAEQMSIAVKEIISLPQEVIEDRFCISNNNGVAIEYFGDAVKGMFGSGFIYTNKDSISVGVGCLLSEIQAKKIRPHELIEHFKSHSSVSCLVRGGKTEEYCAHLIPEAGYHGLPQYLVDNGVILVGDCAGLINASFFHEGSNLSMASGLMAAETVIEAKKEQDFSRKKLNLYIKKLNNSFVIKDLIKFRKFYLLGEKHPELFSEFPDYFAELVTDYFQVSETPKEEIEKIVVEKFNQKIGTGKFINKAFDLANIMNWI